MDLSERPEWITTKPALKGNTRGELRAGHGAAVLAPDRMQPMLLDVGHDLRDVDHLMAHGIGIGLLRKAMTAAIAARREMVESRCDTLGRKQCALVALVPRLSSPIPPARLATPAVGPIRWRVRRRRLARIRRVLVESSLQLQDPSLQARDDLGLPRDDGAQLGDLLVAAVDHTQV